MKKKIIISAAATLAVTLCLLWFLQALLVPKYASESREGNLIAEYYGDAGDHDVIFIGDCEVYENFSPVTLFNEYGITSYIRGSAQQLIWQSYYLMAETFRYETPKVMVFNVLSMKYDTPASTGNQSTREAYNRMTIDGMRWSKQKLECIKASLTNEEREKDAFWSYVFPILRFHDRWSQLKGEDLKYVFKRPQVSDNGYLMQVGVKPLGDEHVEKPLADYSFSQSNWDYLDKMADLCADHGTELVLIKAPTLSPVWWDQWDEQIEEYAKKRGLTYVNYLKHQDEIGIDWSQDTYDTGLHLNVYGAEKMSRFFGRMLVENFGLEDHRGDERLKKIWEEKTLAYEARKQALIEENKNK